MPNKKKEIKVIAFRRVVFMFSLLVIRRWIGKCCNFYVEVNSENIELYTNLYCAFVSKNPQMT